MTTAALDFARMSFAFGGFIGMCWGVSCAAAVSIATDIGSKDEDT